MGIPMSKKVKLDMAMQIANILNGYSQTDMEAVLSEAIRILLGQSCHLVVK